MKEGFKSHTRFVDLFPPPRMLEMPSVGFDISDDVIRFVELKRKGSSFELGLYGEEPLEKDIIEEGYIKDKAKLTAALAAIQKKHNLQFIKASLPEEKSFLFKTEIPMMDEADIRGALQFKIEENVPVSLADAVYDYRILKKPMPGDKTIQVSVTVVHMKVVSSYLDAFKGANLTPIEFQIESQAIAHAAVPRARGDTYILVAMRDTRTVLAIVSGGEVLFTSNIPIGGQAIADSLGKNLNIGKEEVEKIRKGKEVRESNEMFLSLVSAATALRDEVQKLLTYWNSHSQEYGHDNTIRKIIISGSDAMLGLDDYLSRSLEMKAIVADPWINILSIKNYIPPLTLREALDYMPALGLALPYD
jgi:type IV pilus assembly protein PilM